MGKDDLNDNNKDIKNNDYKNFNNENAKQIFVNKVKTDELNKIIINENKKYRKGNINNSNENKNNNNDILNEIYQNKKIFVKKNQEFLDKGDKISIRNKYKNKKYILNSNM